MNTEDNIYKALLKTSLLESNALGSSFKFTLFQEAEKQGMLGELLSLVEENPKVHPDVMGFRPY